MGRLPQLVERQLVPHLLLRLEEQLVGSVLCRRSSLVHLRPSYPAFRGVPLPGRPSSSLHEQYFSPFSLLLLPLMLDARYGLCSLPKSIAQDLARRARPSTSLSCPHDRPSHNDPSLTLTLTLTVIRCLSILIPYLLTSRAPQQYLRHCAGESFEARPHVQLQGPTCGAKLAPVG